MYFGYFEVVRSEKALLAYLFLSTLFMEIILRWQSGEQFLGMGLFFSALFCLALVLLTMSLLHLMNWRFARIAIRIWLLLLTAFFVGQFVYYAIFKTYFTLYSMFHGGQAASFYKLVIDFMIRDPRWILLFLPLILFPFVSKIATWVTRGGFVDYGLLFVLSVLVLMTCLRLFTYGERNTSHLIFSKVDPRVSVHELGMVGNGYGEIARQVVPTYKEIYFAPESSVIPGREANVAYDLGKLLEGEEDAALAELTSHLLSKEPTSKNIFTGRLSGYNLIYVIAESFSDLAVREDVTPTLYRLMNEGVQFENFYNPLWGVSTTDGEYAALTGLYPVPGIWSMVESKDHHLPHTLGNQLKNLGYHSDAFHNHSSTYYQRDKTHENFGYNFYAIGRGLELENLWPASDEEMFRKSFPFYMDQSPFSIYYLTVSGHMGYDFKNNAMSIRHQDKVEHLPFSEEAKAYLACHVELDLALEKLLAELQEKQLLEKTILVVHGDHYPYALRQSSMEELAGKPVEGFDRYKSKIIFYSPGLKDVKVRKLSTVVDLLPTLSNLMGLQYDSRLMMGRDVFSPSKPHVQFADGSFLTPQGSYNSMTGEATGIEEEELESLIQKVEKDFYYSNLIFETDYYRYAEKARIKIGPSREMLSEEVEESPDESEEDSSEEYEEDYQEEETQEETGE